MTLPPSGSGSPPPPGLAARIDRDAFAHSVAWALLAITGWWLDGWTVGLLLLFGPTLPIMLVTWLYLIRRGDIAAVRQARWLVLAAAALVYAGWRALT